MSWWKRFRGGAKAKILDERLLAVVLSLPGWNEEAPHDEMRVWRDANGDVLSLTLAGRSFPPHRSNETTVQSSAREIAEARSGGLIEVRSSPLGRDTTVSFIYKWLKGRAYVFTGMMFVPRQGFDQLWTIVAGEGGTTGVREAVVTAELMNAGTLSIEDYERSWARDPYDSTYAGVDRSALRFMSDDEAYDDRFPEHPLSRVRRTQVALRGLAEMESKGSASAQARD